MAFHVFPAFFGRSSPSKLGLLLLVLSLALLLRCFQLSTTVLATQEAFSWRLTSYPAAEVMQRSAADVLPPFYYVLLRVWLLLWGDCLDAIRSLSVVLGILSIGMAAVLCREAWLFRRTGFRS